MSQKKLKNITLVPTDFSKCAKAAIRHACEIADHMKDDQRVTLLYVIEDTELNEIITEENARREDGSRDSILIEGARSKLDEATEQIKKEFDIPVNFVISGGKPYEEIANVAKKLEAETIVMGSRGPRGPGGIIGSNAAKVVQLSPCPVVVINEDAKANMYKQIILPLDLSKETRQKVKYAVQMAKYFDSVVHVVSAIEEDQFLQNRIKNNLYFVENVLKENNVKYTTEVLMDVDSYVQAILDFSAAKDADLILIMTQEEAGGIKDIIFGSFAQRIVNRSTIPVMCIHPRQEYMKTYSFGGAGYGV